jgi:hypothetical protein
MENSEVSNHILEQNRSRIRQKAFPRIGCQEGLDEKISVKRRFMIWFENIYVFNLCSQDFLPSIFSRNAEPHHFYAAPAPGKNFDAAPAAPAPAPTLLYSKAKFLK